jgi:hypothetical protein
VSAPATARPAAPPRAVASAAMGRRSRTRASAPRAERPPPSGAPRPAAAAAPHAVAPSRRARLAEAPPAPWSPFPLVELCVLVGLVLIAVGVLGHGDRRAAALACGIALASLAGLELAVREHAAGYRSHSALLAGAAAVAVDVPLFFLGVPQIALLAIGALVFASAFLALRRAFQARAGGIGFRA